MACMRETGNGKRQSHQETSAVSVLMSTSIIAQQCENDANPKAKASVCPSMLSSDLGLRPLGHNDEFWLHRKPLVRKGGE